MPLNPQQAAEAGDSYLSKLTGDENVRAGFAAANTPAEIAGHVASVTGMNVTEDDLSAIADHLNANRSAECEHLAMQDPAMAGIISKSG